MRCARVLRQSRALDEVKRRAGDVARGVETVRVAEDVVIAGPVCADRDDRVGGKLPFLGSGCEPAREGLRQLRLARAGEPAEDEETFGPERGGEAQQQRSVHAQPHGRTVGKSLKCGHHLAEFAAAAPKVGEVLLRIGDGIAKHVVERLPV